MFAIRDFIISALVATLIFTGQRAAAKQCNGTTLERTYTSPLTIYGSFTSPGYPSQYSSDETCTRLITAPPGQRVLVYFTSFQLKDCGSSCTCGSVAIYDGPNSDYTLLAKKCGSELPTPVYSSGRNIFVVYHTDRSILGLGFAAKYLSLAHTSGQVLHIPCKLLKRWNTNKKNCVVRACSSTHYGDSTGVVISPGFPWPYPNYRQCDWEIRAPYAMTINLTFTTFDLQPAENATSCSDYVKVSYANGYRNSMRLCGRYQVPFTMTSAGHYLRIQFSSDSSYNSYKGFMAFYQKVEVDRTTARPVASYGCALNSNNVLRVDGTSSIASPLYPNKVPYLYPVSPTRTSPYSNCCWRITTTGRDYLELTFDNMSIFSCGTCDCGNVKVYEGNSANGLLLGTFCEGKTTKVTSKGKAMFVIYYVSFRSDIFKATIRSIRAKASVPVPAIVMPFVIGFLLLLYICPVDKCTKKTPSTGQAGSSNVYEVPLQPLPPSGDSVPPQDFPEHPQETTNMEFVRMLNEGTEPA